MSPAPATPASAVAAAHHRAILIVDDAPDNLGMVRAGLSAQGYHTLVAESGERALNLARRMHPDLILLDMIMPGMDGLETCRRLKSDAATRDIPVIFMSSCTETTAVVASFDQGAVDYMVKPLRMAEVCARVRSQLQLQRLALVDPLTQIANRRHFDSFLSHEWQRAVRSGAPLSLAVLDVDHFKRYNDTLGHAAGDAALRQIAAILQANTQRPSDLAARHGGEEFALLFAGTAARDAAVLAETVRRQVEALALPHPASPSGAVITVSVGVATLVPAREDELARLFLAADQAMYTAKQAGRNRVHVAQWDASGAQAAQALTAS